MIQVGNTLVSWKDKKQTTGAKRSTKAKYRSLAYIVFELVCSLGVLKEVGGEVQLPVQLYCDCKAATQIAENPVYDKRTKYIEIDYHLIRNRLQQG